MTEEKKKNKLFPQMLSKVIVIKNKLDFPVIKKKHHSKKEVSLASKMSQYR